MYATGSHRPYYSQIVGYHRVVITIKIAVHRLSLAQVLPRRVPLCFASFYQDSNSVNYQYRDR